MSEVRLLDGATETLEVTATPTTTVTNATAPTRVEFHALNPSSTTSSSVGTGVVYTTRPVPVGGGVDNGTGGLGQVIGGSIRYRQRTPAATWTFAHPLGRTPQVTVYLSPDDDLDGPLEQVDTYVEADDATVVVTWPYPVAGELIVQ